MGTLVEAIKRAESHMKRFYVYAYYEPGEELPFYIGKGSGQRAWFHLSPSAYNRINTFFYNKLKKMIDSGVIPEVSLVHENLTEEEANVIEQDLIAMYGHRVYNTGTLCNLTEGGESPGNGLVGYTQTPEHVENRMKQMRGRKHDKVWVENQREGNRWRMLSVTAVNIITGEETVYESVTAASLDGYSRRHIYSCLKGQRRSHQGKTWHY